MLLIEQSLWENANCRPDKTAVVCGKTSVTYRQLAGKVFAAKMEFEAMEGYAVGNKVVIAAKKQLEFLYAYFGAHLARLTVVPLDPDTSSARLDYIVEATRPICIIGFNQETVNWPTVSLDLFSDISYDGGGTPNFPDASDIADVMFTTGTTGTPKGVLLSFGNEAAAADHINIYIGNTIDDVEMLALPICHSFGLGRLRCCLSKGQTVILMNSFVNVKKLFRNMADYNVTGFSMVPASWKYISMMSGGQISTFASQLRYIEMGSAFLSVDDKRQLAELLPETKIAMHYGLTEASRSTFLDFHQDVAHLDSVGKAAPSTSVKAFDEDGHVLPAGADGELCVKGDHVMVAYLDNSSQPCFYTDGYFRTGDLGRVDENGYVYLKSRIKELINVGGKKVAPAEVEELLLKADGVVDCACVAMPDPDGVLGEVVRAFVVRAEGDKAANESLTEFLTGKIEAYKIPRHYDWTDKIPRTSSGKIQRNLLHDDTYRG